MAVGFWLLAFSFWLLACAQKEKNTGETGKGFPVFSFDYGVYISVDLS